MLDRLNPIWRNIALGVLVVFVGWFCWSIRTVLNPLILGYLLAFVVHPMVLKLERRGWSRRTAVNVIFVASGVSMLLVSLAVFAQGRSLVRQLSDPELYEEMLDRLEEELEQQRERIGGWIAYLPGEDAAPADEPADATEPEQSLLAELGDALRETLLSEERLAETGEAGLAAAGGLLVLLRRIFGSIMTVGTMLFLLPLYTYFLLFQLESIHSFVRRYIPVSERTRLSRVGTQIGEVLANFFRGRLLVSLLKGLAYTLGLWIVDVDYALLLGLSTGFLSLIPFVGSLIGFVLACVIGFLDHSLVGSLVRVTIVFTLTELLENYLLVPKILGDTLSLPPIVVIFAIMAGGAAFGMFGLLVALPACATLVILAKEFLLPTLDQIANEKPAK